MRLCPIMQSGLLSRLIILAIQLYPHTLGSLAGGYNNYALACYWGNFRVSNDGIIMGM